MEWKAAWSYRPVDYNTTIGTIENITQRTVFFNNVSGSKVKLKFSNRYGTEPLTLNKVVIGQIKLDSDEISDSVVVTSNGQECILLEAGQEFYSDAVNWNIEAGSRIVVSVYIGEKTNIGCGCSNWSAKSWYTRYLPEGDHTYSQKLEGLESREVYPYVEADVNKANIIVGVCEIALETERQVKTIAMFGDSITHMSYYSDALLNRLMKEYPGQATLLNRGIGGNRVLRDASHFPGMDGDGKCFGEAGVSRYEKDLFEDYTPDAVLFLAGVNDIMHPYIFAHPEEIVTAKQLASAVESMAATIHAKGAKFYVGTIMPFRNDEMGTLPDGEKVRVNYNEWVRNQQIADGVLDFDQIIRKEDAIEYMQDGTHIGDGLHPNTCGGMRMAEIVPLQKIMEEC